MPNADKLKKQLRDLWGRHQEFSSIILSGYKCSSMVPGAEIDFTSITVPYKSPSVPNCSVVVDSLVSAWSLALSSRFKQILNTLE